MGKPRRDALRDLGTRTGGVEDLIGFTVALVQADQLGVSIGNVLRVQSEEMRRRRQAEGGRGGDESADQDDLSAW